MASSEVSTAPDARACRIQIQGPRLSRVLQGIVIDALCPQASSVLSPAEHEWLVKAASKPAGEGTEAALDALRSSLSQMLENAPPSFLAKLEALRCQAELGSD